MSLEHVLCVDDSEAVLSLERAALGAHYAVVTATNGLEALARLEQLRPACVLLDLSMPEMDGDEVLVRMKAQASLRDVPVIVITSETARAEKCLLLGATAFLPKPIRPRELLALVGRTIDERARLETGTGLRALPLEVGSVELGVELDAVRNVLLDVATRPLVGGTPELGEVFELGGTPVPVLDLATLLLTPYRSGLTDRKLVAVATPGDLLLALRVDEVRDPEELAPADVTPRERLAGREHGRLGEVVVAVARTSRGPLPIVDPAALVSPELLRLLPELLRAELSRPGPVRTELLAKGAGA